MTWRSTALRITIIILAALAAFGWCLQTPWYMDDQLHLFKSQKLLDDQWQFKHAEWRMWTYIVWIGLKHLVGGVTEHAQAFHALNLAMHTAIAVALFFLLRKLWSFRPNGTDKGAANFAMWGALVFAVHTAGSEVPHYAAQTSMQWVTLFSLFAGISGLSILRRPGWLPERFAVAWLVLSIVTMLLWIGLATFSKEVGFLYSAATPTFLIAMLAPWKKIIAVWQKRRALITGIVVVVLTGLTIFYFKSNWNEWLERSLAKPHLKTHMLTQSRIFWEYTQRIVVPVNLCSDHMIAATVDGRDKIAALSTFGLLIVLTLSIGSLFTKRKFGAMLICLGLVPIMARFVYPGAEYMVEYRLYPSMPWMGAFMALALLHASERWKKLVFPRYLPHAAVLTLIGLSYDRAQDWKGPFSISENILEQYPNHIRIQSYIQWHELDGGTPEKAIARQEEISKSLNEVLRYNRNARHHHRKYNTGKVFGAYMASEQLAANAMTAQGRPQDALKRLNSVIEQFKKMRAGDDDSRGFGVLYRARGLAHMAMGKFDKSRADLTRSLEIHPGDVTTRSLLQRLEREEAKFKARQAQRLEQIRKQREQQRNRPKPPGNPVQPGRTPQPPRVPLAPPDQ